MPETPNQTPENRPESQPTAPQEAPDPTKAAQGRIETANLTLDSLKTGVKRIAAGFGRMAEHNARQRDAILSTITPEEKRQLLEELSKGEVIPEKTQLRLQQMDVIRNFADGVKTHIEQPKTLGGRFIKFMMSVDPHSTDSVRRSIQKIQDKLKIFYEQEYPSALREIMTGEKTMAQIAETRPVMQEIIKSNKMQEAEAQSEEDTLKDYGNLVTRMRQARQYDRATLITQQLLQEDFDKAKGRIDPARKDALENENIKVSVDLWKKYEPEWKRQGMTDDQVTAFALQLTEDRMATVMNEEAAKHFDPSGLSGEKLKLWEQYNDMNDPKGEWFNAKDATWDKIYDEVAINAPLIVLSGGAASLARATLSNGARMVVGRIAAREVLKGGAEVGVRELTKQGAKVITEWAGTNLLKKGTLTAGGLLVEGTAFEMAHLGLQGEWIGNMPDWGQRILWSAVTLGTIKGAGQIAGRAFKETVKIGEQTVTRDVLLGKYLKNITNPAVREGAEQLLLKGHAEAASMLLIGAVRNGAFDGNLKEFFDNFGDEVLHAYITVGALKVAHSGVEAATGKLFLSREEITKRMERAYPIDKPIDAGYEASVAPLVMKGMKPIIVQRDANGKLTDVVLTYPQGKDMKGEMERNGYSMVREEGGVIDMTAPDGTTVHLVAETVTAPGERTSFEKGETVALKSPRNKSLSVYEVDAIRPDGTYRIMIRDSENGAVFYTVARAEELMPYQGKEQPHNEEIFHTGTEIYVMPPFDGWKPIGIENGTVRMIRDADDGKHVDTGKAPQSITHAESGYIVIGKASQNVYRVGKMENGRMIVKDVPADNVHIQTYHPTSEAVGVRQGDVLSQDGTLTWTVTKVDKGTYELQRPSPIPGAKPISITVDAHTIASWQMSAVKDAKDPSISEVEQRQRALQDVAREKQTNMLNRLNEQSTLSTEEYARLFNGPLQQQNVGNCGLIGTLEAMRQSPHFEQMMRTSIRAEGEGHWVSLPFGSVQKTTDVFITNADISPQTSVGSDTGITLEKPLLPVKAADGWKILEAAFLKSQTGAVNRSLMTGTESPQALRVFFGENAEVIAMGDSPGRKTTFNQQTDLERSNVQAWLDNFNPKINIATVGSIAGESSFMANAKEGQMQILHSHAYSIRGVNKADGTVSIANPHNTGAPFTLTYNEFFRVFSHIEGATINHQRQFQ